MEKNYKYLGYAMMLLIPLTFIGFYRTYFSLYPDFKNLKGLHHFHGAVAGLWIGILVIQPLLIQAKKITWHKWLGKLSYFVFPILILSMAILINLQGPNFEIKGVFIPAADVVLLILFYTLAIVNKKRTDLHMRYMIASALVFIDPTVVRALILPVFGVENPAGFHIIFAIIYAILFGLILFDRINGKNFRPYLVASLAFFVYQVGFQIIYVL